MPTMTVLVDGTIPVAADFMANFNALNQALGTGTVITGYTTGDLLYASATNALSKLAKGTTGQILTQGASIPAWADGGRLLAFTNPTALSTAGTYWAGGSVGFQSADSNLGKFPVSAGTIKTLRAWASSAPAGGSLVFTLQVDGADTALTATMGAAQTSATDLTNAVTVTSGQTVAMALTKTGADNLDCGVTVEYVKT